VKYVIGKVSDFESSDVDTSTARKSLDGTLAIIEVTDENIIFDSDPDFNVRGPGVMANYLNSDDAKGIWWQPEAE
jgi:hypothetical protein